MTFNARFHAFARYWDERPVACAPYRARTKGKDERGVGYVKHNAIAGRSFASWGALEAHLAWWMREVADMRVHGTTGEAPIVRFAREETAALRPLNGRPPFRQIRIHHASTEVACHDKRPGRRERAVERAHLHGIVAGRREMPGDAEAGPVPSAGPLPDLELLRSLAEYEQVAGGGW